MDGTSEDIRQGMSEVEGTKIGTSVSGWDQ